jgi:hypothetical protein
MGNDEFQTKAAPPRHEASCQSWSGSGTMTSFKRRSRLVTFRVSVEEYEDLSRWSKIAGSRSISEFARAAVRQNVQALRVPAGTLTGDLASLVRALSEMDAAMGEMQRRIRGVLGSAGTDDTRRQGPDREA